MGYLFVLGYVLLVGLATFLMKVNLKVLTPYQLNFLMGIGMLITGIPALLIAQKSFKLPAKEIPVGLTIGIMMAAGSILYVLALNRLSASVASVLAATYVAVVVVLSWLVLKEHFDVIKSLGVAFTFIGALLLTYKS
ncbi:MAG TPA: EamA family transporter [Candidatus Saccharimonadales bacterium]|nr:EamA family transporter [Candidatus Saccharimonadales bacterium]